MVFSCQLLDVSSRSLVLFLLGCLLSATCRGVLLPQPHGHESIWIEIRLQKSSGRPCGAKQSFGGQITAADGAFHRGGPAGVGPIARQEQARHGGLLLGAPAIDSGLGRKCGGGFLYDRWLPPFRRTRRRPVLS